MYHSLLFLMMIIIMILYLQSFRGLFLHLSFICNVILVSESFLYQKDYPTSSVLKFQFLMISLSENTNLCNVIRSLTPLFRYDFQIKKTDISCKRLGFLILSTCFSFRDFFSLSFSFLRVCFGLHSRYTNGKDFKCLFKISIHAS